MPDRRKSAIFLLTVFLTFSSCMDRDLRGYRKILSDGRYDSEFPSRNASGELGSIAQSVRKLYSVSYYTTWQFTRETRVLPFHIVSGLFTKMAIGTISTQESVSGSATIAMADGKKVALLTCSHIVHSPDTVVSWYDPSGEDQMPVIRSISIKEKQENWVRGMSGCGPFTVLATDPELDVAIIGTTCTTMEQEPVVFPYPYGSSSELEWGSFVYLFGYPAGTPAITKAIVSKPLRDDPDEFTVDALLNKGYSGGIILAIRDGVPHFELVGMVRAVSSEEEYYLRPATSDKRYYEIFPYRGELFADTREEVHYGINFTVPAGKIIGFYKKHRYELVREGYDLDPFFGLAEK
jgi:hypothetical protein